MVLSIGCTLDFGIPFLFRNKIAGSPSTLYITKLKYFTFIMYDTKRLRKSRVAAIF